MTLRKTLLALVALWAISAGAQGPLTLDTTFRTEFQYQNVNDVLVLDDGNLLLSGQIRVPEDPIGSIRTSVKVDPNGDRVMDFPGFPYSAGGTYFTPWNDKIYVGNRTVRRLNNDGLRDNSFIEMDADPTFSSLQGGDYHVYPDGRVLLTGLHQIYEPDGTSDFYSLIWFTDSGWVDHDIEPRQSNAPIRQIEEEPDGQFLCFYSGTEYEGQATHGRIFRIHADGTLDTTLQSRVVLGSVWTLLPLPDGRFYASGSFQRSGVVGPIKLARFLPNGDLDPTFDHGLDLDLGEIPDPGTGGIAAPVQHWRNGRLVVMGAFQTANGEVRRSICVVDSNGVLTDEFAGCGVDPYIYQGSERASVNGLLETDDGMLYLWGSYHGYNDGNTHDTLQRFVTRLYGPDWPTAVVEEEDMQEKLFRLHPNPTHGQVTITRERAAAATSVLLRDGTGRVVLEQGLKPMTEIQLELGHLAAGCYTVEVLNGGQRIALEKLVLQP